MRILLFIIGLCFFNGLTAKEKIYIPFFTCENCPQNVATAATYLFAEYVEEKGVFEVEVSQKRDSLGQVETIGDIKESAELFNASYYIDGMIIHLDGQYFVSIKLQSMSGNMAVWSDIKGVKDIEQLPTIIKYMGVHLGNNKKMSQAGDVYLTTGIEAAKSERARSNKAIGAMVGGFVPLDGREINKMTAGAGLLASMDVKNFIFQLHTEMYFGSDSILLEEQTFGDARYKTEYLNISIQVLYPLSTTNNAPFVCLGTGFSHRKTEINQNNGYWKFDHYGMIANGGGGYILRRNADATLFIFARAYVFAPSVDDLTYGASLNLALTLGN